jgi:transcriptional regulator GlxA family with amidase domain
MIEVALVVPPGFQMMILASMTAFEVANIASGETVYNIRVLSEHGGPVRSSLEHFSIGLGVSRVREISVAFFFGNTFEK